MVFIVRASYHCSWRPWRFFSSRSSLRQLLLSGVIKIILLLFSLIHLFLSLLSEVFMYIYRYIKMTHARTSNTDYDNNILKYFSTWIFWYWKLFQILYKNKNIYFNIFMCRLQPKEISKGSYYPNNISAGWLNVDWLTLCSFPMIWIAKKINFYIYLALISMVMHAGRSFIEKVCSLIMKEIILFFKLEYGILYL